MKNNVIYILLTVIFNLISCLNLYSQGLSVKWESLYESEDTNVVKYLNSSTIDLDNSENVFTYLFNDALVPSFNLYNSSGLFLFNKNLYFTSKKQDSAFRRLNSNSERNITIKYFPNLGSFTIGYFVTPANYEAELLVFNVCEVNKIENTGIVEFENKATQKDFLGNPRGLIQFIDYSFLVFSSYNNIDSIVKLNPDGVTNTKYYNGGNNSLTRLQIIVDVGYDTIEKKIYGLSGHPNSYPTFFPNRPSFYGFQIRNFAVNQSKKDIEFTESFTVYPKELGSDSAEFYPSQLLTNKDNHFVLGKMKEANVTTTVLATITKSGEIVNLTHFAKNTDFLSACFSPDSSKIVLVGRRIEKVDSTYYTFHISEFDLDKYVVNDFDFNRTVVSKTLNSVKAFKNGDYCVSGTTLYPYMSFGFQRSFITTARITHTPTSTNENPTPKTTLKVTPNPSTEMATVEFESSHEASTIQLVDVKGNVLRTLYQKTTQNIHQSSVTFRVSDLANGMYYVVVGNGTKTLETVPLSIQR